MRYLKVCRPLHTQMQLREAKVSVAVAVFTGLVFSWPAPVIYGVRTVETKIPGIVGENCDSLDGIIFLTYHVILAVALVIFTAALAVLYGMVGMAAKRHKRYMRRISDVEISGRKKTSVSSLESSTTCDVSLSYLDVAQPQPQPQPQPKPYPQPPTQQKQKGVHKIKNKTTVIGFTVTLVFVVSFLPFISLMAVGAFVKNFDYDLKGGSLVAYNVFVRSYFINSAANPFIYGVLNIRFRDESVTLLKKMLCCLKLIFPSAQPTP
ncbi:uncharacterized protein LOC121377799 [Gigantopelta aegis]|uniref:uncharacterized protein LOC121377799 n=1 Tax=Gigantopelta aegis TaxID=1735272 RepID=UPI001B887963|nr:uncharacterized protein LOC121377799 [Gigantopelta aegis]